MEKTIFPATISNEQTALLPAALFEGPIVVVDREEQIEKACAELSASPIIGFDTETRPSFMAGVTYRVALLQLSTYRCCYLFRLNRIRFDKLLVKLLENKAIIKVGADVAGDIRSLSVLRHFRPGGFVDLQQLAPMWGIEEKSLRKLSAIVLGKRVSKAQRLSNWEASSLTEKQLRYAATDAWICPEIYRVLQQTPKP
jgi:ribonuclease D